MLFKRQKTPDTKLLKIMRDISKYMNYLGIVSYGMSGHCYEIKFLPLSKSYDDHPYWLIEKLEFIKEKVNTKKLQNLYEIGGIDLTKINDCYSIKENEYLKVKQMEE